MSCDARGLDAERLKPRNEARRIPGKPVFYSAALSTKRARHCDPLRSRVLGIHGPITGCSLPHPPPKSPTSRTEATGHCNSPALLRLHRELARPALTVRLVAEQQEAGSAQRSRWIPRRGDRAAVGTLTASTPADDAEPSEGWGRCRDSNWETTYVSNPCSRSQREAAHSRRFRRGDSAQPTIGLVSTAMAVGSAWVGSTPTTSTPFPFVR